MSQKKTDQQIIHHDLALDTYFNALFDETPEEHLLEKDLILVVDVN